MLKFLISFDDVIRPYSLAGLLYTHSEVLNIQDKAHLYISETLELALPWSSWYLKNFNLLSAYTECFLGSRSAFVLHFNIFHIDHEHNRSSYSLIKMCYMISVYVTVVLLFNVQKQQQNKIEGVYLMGRKEACVTKYFLHLPYEKLG